MYETREIKIYFNVELSMDPIVSGFTDLLRFRIARNVTLPEGILLDEKTGRLYGISQLPIDEYEITIIATEEIEREFTMTISVTRNYCYENNYFVETLSGDSTSTSCPNGEGSLIGTCSLGENPKWEIFMNTCPPTLPPENITYSETYYSFYRYQKSSIPPPECGGNIFNYTSFESDVFLPKGLILSKNGGIEGIPVDRKGNYTLHIRMVNIDTYSEYTELTINLYDRECEGDDYLDNIISGESVSETCKGTTDELIIAECSIDEEAVMIYSLDNCCIIYSNSSKILLL